MTKKATKHHVNPDTGEVNPCYADKKPCPHGGESGVENHYATVEEAREASERILSEKHGEENSRRHNVSVEESRLDRASAAADEANEEHFKVLRQYDNLAQQVELMSENISEGPTEARREFAREEHSKLLKRLNEVSKELGKVSSQKEKSTAEQRNALAGYAEKFGSEQAFEKLNSGDLGNYDRSHINPQFMSKFTSNNQLVSPRFTRLSRTASSIGFNLEEDGYDVSGGSDLYVHKIDYSDDGNTVNLHAVGDEDLPAVGNANISLTANRDGSFSATGETYYTGDVEEGDNAYEARESIGNFDGLSSAPNIAAASMMSRYSVSQELRYWAKSHSPILAEGNEAAETIRDTNTSSAYVISNPNDGSFKLFDHDNNEIGEYARDTPEARGLNPLRARGFSDLHHNELENSISIVKLSGEPR